MKALLIVLLAVVVISLRVGFFRYRRRRNAPRLVSQGSADAGTSEEPTPHGVHTSHGARAFPLMERSLGVVGLIAGREITERIRGRLFRIGTLIILLAVAAAIIIPTLHHSSSTGSTAQRVGIVGTLSSQTKQVIHAAGSQDQDTVTFVLEPSLGATKADLRSGRIYLAIVDGNRVLTNEPASASSSPADPTFVGDVAYILGQLKVYRSAGLTPDQASRVIHASSVPVQTLKPASKSTTKTTSVIGLVLLFVMLTQYNTWILIGVMQEKSSRVVEVLLAVVRPIQLLGGKVLGIGLVALGQATLIVGFALAVAGAVGSNLLHGSAPLVLLCQLLWLVLGYAFYCWVYAAGGSTAERQDQVQTLAFPLSIPILIGYIFSITVASSGNADLLYKILAYLPPTAPFCMPVLVGLSQVTWWEFTASVLITIAATAAMAVFAAGIYGRAVLRTGGRVRLRDVVGGPGH
jgi:ABC-2 type transport system permease protein